MNLVRKGYLQVSGSISTLAAGLVFHKAPRCQALISESAKCTRAVLTADHNSLNITKPK